MHKLLDGIQNIIFCDESKFYIKNGDYEDATYYFGIAVNKSDVPKVHHEFIRVMAKWRIKQNVFHSTSLFKETRPRSALMNDLAQIIIDNQLKCFCYKYSKSIFFEPTKHLIKYNTDIIKFEKEKFQALFYFLIILNTYLRDEKPKLLQKEISMYFDRDVYGIKEVEAFNFPDADFIFKQMTFCEKSLISLLYLPDFFGYIFRKSKAFQNRVQFGENNIASSELTINCHKCLADINRSKLFHFLDVDNTILGKALGISFSY